LGGASFEGSGTLLEYRLRWRSVPIFWRTEISVWEPPARFVDRQIKGLGFLLRDLVAITNNANHCCARRAWNPDVERRARIPCDGIARSGDRSSRRDRLRKTVSGRERVNRAEGIPGPNRRKNRIGTGVIWIDSRLLRQKHMLTGQTEDREVARKARNAPVVDQHIGVRIGTANTGNRAVRR